jgi:Zn-dependent M28 family amino/carboxypeptidase
MARVAAASPARFRRSVVFVAFAGEELGLRGSKHYVEHPVIPLDRTVAMVNLDMVGRARGRVLVGSFGWRGGFPALFRRMRSWTRLRLEDFLRGGGYQPDQSDGASFAGHGVPAIAFFTGFHADYHRPSDDWPRIDAQGGAEVARLALRVVEELARRRLDGEASGRRRTTSAARRLPRCNRASASVLQVQPPARLGAEAPDRAG